MKQFIVTVQHDKGKAKIRVPAMNEEAARVLAATIEGCPPSAIIRVREAAYIKKDKSIS